MKVGRRGRGLAAAAAAERTEVDSKRGNTQRDLRQDIYSKQ